MAPPTALVAVPPVITLPNHKGVNHFQEPTLSQFNSPPSSTSVVPLIDLQGLNDPLAKASIIEAIDKACADWGLFLVVNHGIEISILEEMLEAAKAFFTLPLEEKMKYTAKDRPDLMNYILRPDLTWREVLRHQGCPASDEIIQLWPSKPSNYRDVAKAFLEATRKLAMRLERAIFERLGKDEEYAEGMANEGFQYMLCNYYPPSPQPHLALGMGPHTDQCLIGVLMDNNVDGLQLRHEDTWVTVPHVPTALVVFLGKSMERVSEGRYKAAEHQVVANEKMTRISLAVGNGPEIKGFDSMKHI